MFFRHSGIGCSVPWQSGLSFASFGKADTPIRPVQPPEGIGSARIANGEEHAPVMPARKRVCFVASSPLTVRAFLSPHIAVLSTQFDVSVAVNAAAETFAARALGARVFTVPVERRISVLHDLWALMRLTSIFWRNQFDVVHSVTPKAPRAGA